MVGGTLALDLEEDGQFLEVVAVPVVEGREQLQALRLWAHVHVHVLSEEGEEVYEMDEIAKKNA